jgi:hypothetical protein
MLTAQNEDCTGVITGITGNVHVRKAKSESLTKAYWGFQLFKGDQVITSDNSEVTITFQNNTVMKLGQGSMMTLTTQTNNREKTNTSLKKISSASTINLAALTSRKEKTKESGALAGLRTVGSEKSLLPELPINSLIRTIRPSFAWTANRTFDAFQISLYSSSGLVWKKRITGTSMNFPENEPDLVPGQSYFWNIEAEGMIENEKSDNFKFSVVSAEKAREIENQESEIKDALKEKDETSSLHSALGAFYINQGLIHEAINEFEIIAGLNNESAVPHEILGSLYNEIGNKDRAIDELKIALSLAKLNLNKD